MKVWRIVSLKFAGLYVGLKGIFLMVTGMCILAGAFIAFPLVLDFVEKSRVAWQPATNFPFYLFNWLASIVWWGTPLMMLFIPLAWSIFFMFLGIKVLKGEE